MTGTVSSRFVGWLASDLRPALGIGGYAGSGSTFHRRAPAGWGVVDFQKSQYGSRRTLRFTVNFGVALDRLSVAKGDDPGSRPPEHRCAWRCRIGMLMDDPADHWWLFDGDTDPARLSAEMMPLIVERGLPFIDVRLTEAGFVAALAERPRIGQIARFTDAQVRDILAGPA